MRSHSIERMLLLYLFVPRVSTQSAYKLIRNIYDAHAATFLYIYFYTLALTIHGGMVFPNDCLA